MPCLWSIKTLIGETSAEYGLCIYRILIIFYFNRCRTHCGYMNIGGEEITETVNSVFAALVWHTQVLREEVDRISK